MKRTFKAQCPYCGSEVQGLDDWGEGMICIQGCCDKCEIILGEDECDWAEVRDARKLLEKRDRRANRCAS